MSNLDPAVAREVCMVAGHDGIMDQEGAKKIMELLRDYFAPESADSTNQEAVCFSQFKTYRPRDGWVFRAL